MKFATSLCISCNLFLNMSLFLFSNYLLLLIDSDYRTSLCMIDDLKCTPFRNFLYFCYCSYIVRLICRAIL